MCRVPLLMLEVEKKDVVQNPNHTEIELYVDNLNLNTCNYPKPDIPPIAMAGNFQNQKYFTD